MSLDSFFFSLSIWFLSSFTEAFLSMFVTGPSRLSILQPHGTDCTGPHLQSSQASCTSRECATSIWWSLEWPVPTKCQSCSQHLLLVHEWSSSGLLPGFRRAYIFSILIALFLQPGDVVSRTLSAFLIGECEPLGIKRELPQPFLQAWRSASGCCLSKSTLNRTENSVQARASFPIYTEWEC